MYNILYVEDNFESYKLVEFVLKKHGFKVKNAVDGLDAIDKVKEDNPDLIIMDINLPNMMGYEVVSWLKSTEQFRHIPVVALTAAYSDDYEYLSKTSGCVAYYTKPVDPISFGKEILEIIDNHQDFEHSDGLSKEISKSLEDKARRIQNLNRKIVGYENKISNILSNLPDIILITDDQFRITYYNSQAIQNNVFRNNYEQGENFFSLFSLTSMEYSDFTRFLEEKGHLDNIEIELNSENENYLFLGNFNRMQPEEILISLREISNRAKFEEKMDQIDKMAGLGLITSGIIHEINNPLTAIKTYMQVFRMKVNDDSLLNVVNKLEEGFTEIESLTNSLLSFAKPSQEKMYPVNLNNIIKELMSFAEYEIRRGNVDIKLQLDENLPNISGVKSQLEQALLNILLNANFAVQECENPVISIQTYLQDDYVVLSISDNGPGINDDIKEKIFEPFYTTKPKEKATGLGLSIVKQIVERHGGDLDLTTDNQGTTFYMKFKRIEKEGE